MSQENVELVWQRAEHFMATGEVEDEWYDPDFVWDMSTFAGWPEKKHYHGVAGFREFLSEWLKAWDDWHIELAHVHDAEDDRVVSVFRQSGSRSTLGST